MWDTWKGRRRRYFAWSDRRTESYLLLLRSRWNKAEHACSRVHSTWRISNAVANTFCHMSFLSFRDVPTQNNHVTNNSLLSVLRLTLTDRKQMHRCNSAFYHTTLFIERGWVADSPTSLCLWTPSVDCKWSRNAKTKEIEGSAASPSHIFISACRKSRALQPCIDAQWTALSVWSLPRDNVQSLPDDVSLGIVQCFL